MINTKAKLWAGPIQDMGAIIEKVGPFLALPLLRLALQHKCVIQRTDTIKLRGNFFMKVWPVLSQLFPPIHQRRIFCRFLLPY